MLWLRILLTIAVDCCLFPSNLILLLCCLLFVKCRNFLKFLFRSFSKFPSFSKLLEVSFFSKCPGGGGFFGRPASEQEQEEEQLCLCFIEIRTSWILGCSAGERDGGMERL